MVYNANTEKRMGDLIGKSSKGNLSEGVGYLKQAIGILNQEFATSHYGDLPDQDTERIEVRKKFYESIIGAYVELVKGFIENDYEKLKANNKELLAERGELNLKITGLESNINTLETNKETLEETVQNLTIQNTLLLEAQERIKRV